MPIFRLEEDQLIEIKEESFELEKDIQKLTEKNIKKIFNLKFIKTEFSLKDLRIDTLAYDLETKSFVIIEYKKDKNISIIDQGYAYLSLLLNNKADLILEYNENLQDSLKREDVDWTQSRVIFISPFFTKYQKQAINFKDLPIELWEIKKFTNNTILYNQLKSPETSESINKISQKSDVVKSVSKEVKVWVEEDHLEEGSEKSLDIYKALREKITGLGDDVIIKPRKLYIGFKRNTNFVDIGIQRSKIKLWINLRKGTLDDPKNLARDITNIGHWGNGDYEISIEDLKNIDYIIALIKQSYDKN